MRYGRIRSAAIGFGLLAMMCASARSVPVTMAQGRAPQIASLSIVPDRIAAGETTVLTIELDQPAPDGFVVGISQITNTGVTDTIVNMPVLARFDAGAQRFPITIRTQRKTDRVTDILFTAFHYNDRKSAQLIIN